MKSFTLSILFLCILSISFAQKYDYDINGNNFAGTLLKSQNNNIKIIVEDKVQYVFEKNISNRNRKVYFQNTQLDTNYIYHKVGEENIEYILNLYQICAPCFAEWNNFELKYSTYPLATSEKDKKRIIKKNPIAAKKMMFEYLKAFDIFEGEYLKVALKKDYKNGTAAMFKKKKIYQNITKKTYIYDIVRNYNININDLRRWNNLAPYLYYIENMTLIVGETEYKYACPCFD